MIPRVPIQAFPRWRTNLLTVFALLGGASFQTSAIAVPWNTPERITHNTVREIVTSGSLVYPCPNEAYAVWLEELEGGSGWRIMWSKRTFFGGWLEPEPVDPGTHQDHEPRLEFGPESEGLSAVWHRGEGPTTEIMYAEKPFGGDWIVEPVTMNLTEDMFPDLPPEGSTHIVWVGFDAQSKQGKIYHAARTASSWTIEVLAGSDPGPFWTGASPRIDVDSNGVVHVVYRGGDFGNYHLHYARKVEDFWTYQILTSLNGNDFSADVYTGNLIYARAGLPPEILPPLDMANESPCAGQSLCVSSQSAGDESVLYLNHQNAGYDSAIVTLVPGAGIEPASPARGSGF